MKTLLTFLLISLSCGFVLCQESHLELVKRFEFPSSDKSYNYFTLSLGEQGFFIRYMIDEKPKQYKHYIRYDNKFNKIDEFKCANPLSHNEYSFFISDKVGYEYAYDPKSGDVILTILDLTSKVVIPETHKWKLPGKVTIRDFKKVGENLVALCQPNKKERRFLIFNLATKKFNTVIPEGESERKYTFWTYGLIQDEYQLQYKYSEKDGEGMAIYRYDENATLIADPIKITLGKEKRILRLRVTQTTDNRGFLIAGTYSNGKNYSNGLVTGRFDNNGTVKNIVLTNFLDVDNFTDFMWNGAEKKIMKQKERKEDKGKEKLYRGLTLVHGFQYSDNANYLVCEFYYKSYRIEEFQIEGKIQRRRTFDGYIHTHALVAKVSDEGGIEWSNIFEMKLFNHPYYIRRYIETKINLNKEESVELSYASNYGIKFITYAEDDGKILDQEYRKFRVSEKEGEKIKFTKGTNVTRWTDDLYVVSGFQKVKESGEGNKKEKKYFFEFIKY